MLLYDARANQFFKMVSEKLPWSLSIPWVNISKYWDYHTFLFVDFQLIQKQTTHFIVFVSSLQDHVIVRSSTWYNKTLLSSKAISVNNLNNLILYWVPWKKSMIRVKCSGYSLKSDFKIRACGNGGGEKQRDFELWKKSNAASVNYMKEFVTKIILQSCPKVGQNRQAFTYPF